MGKAGQAPNVDKIMSEIRASILASCSADDSRARKVAYQPRPPKEGERAAPLIYLEELNYLNCHWGDWFTSFQITSHRPVIGKVIVRLKKFFLDLAWKYLLKDYLERERHFQSNLVRYLNATAKYVDSRDAEIFWQIVEKIDNDVSGMNERIDRLYDEATSTLRSSERGLQQSITALTGQQERIGATASQTASELATVNSAVLGLERCLAMLSRTDGIKQNDHKDNTCTVTASDKAGEIVSSSSANKTKCWPLGENGVDYLLFENRFRGDEQLIRERVVDYVGYFKGADKPVLDIGCGRGEFLDCLKDSGIPAMGVDLDTAMVRRSTEKGHEVVHINCLDYLARCDDSSLGGLFGAQIVEHLQREDLEKLLRLAAKKVVPGGAVLLETINPQSFAALARNFFRDPTHVWPVHPDTLSYMMQLQGLQAEEVLMRSQYPEEGLLKEVDVSAHLPARWQIAMRGLNDNILRLNDLLFGYQDYCAVARVPKQ
ncbi:MAG: class I SAM-dependent methyltransferase [bacterium]|nr:class I SAM-dependent methyltransferase [bacterium]